MANKNKSFKCCQGMKQGYKPNSSNQDRIKPRKIREGHCLEAPSRADKGAVMTGSSKKEEKKKTQGMRGAGRSKGFCTKSLLLSVWGRLKVPQEKASDVAAEGV